MRRASERARSACGKGAAGSARTCAAAGAPALSSRLGNGTLQRLVSSRSVAPSSSSPGGGRPLDGEMRSFFEPRLGWDLGDVRLHTDERAAASARALGSEAYTVGRDIVFARAAYEPGTETGRRLLAHELVHVAQQQEAGAPAVQRKVTVKDPSVNIPNPGGKGLVQTNAKTVEDYFKTLCPEPSAGIAVDPKSGDLSIATAFCTEAPLPPDVYGPPSPPPAQLSSYRTGCGCLCDLSASTHTWQVQVDDSAWPNTVFDNATDAITPGVGTGGVVTTPSPNSPKLWGAATAGGKTLNIDPWLVLGHELCGHAWLGNWGAHGPDEILPRGMGGHQATVARENLLRAEHGIELRGTFKQPYCGESFWRDRAKPGTVNWSSYLSTCRTWRAAYNKAHGTTYKISDTIP